MAPTGLSKMPRVSQEITERGCAQVPASWMLLFLGLKRKSEALSSFPPSSLCVSSGGWGGGKEQKVHVARRTELLLYHGLFFDRLIPF